MATINQKAKMPASIGRIRFDAIIQRETQYEADVPEYPVETGFYTSDTVIKKPITLNVTAFISNTPVTWRRQLNEPNRVANTIRMLEKLYFSGETFSFITSKKTYSSMALTSLTVPETAEMANAVEVKFTLKQIRTAKSKLYTIPRNYGLSGTTAQSGGTANTKEEKDETTTKKSCSLLYGLFGNMFGK